MTTDQLRRHIASIEQGRTEHTAPVLDPVLARLRAELRSREWAAYLASDASDTEWAARSGQQAIEDAVRDWAIAGMAEAQSRPRIPDDIDRLRSRLIRRPRHK